MLEFIVKYWLEVAFGLVCASIAWLARHYVKLLEEKKKSQQKEIIDTMKQGLEEHKNQMKSDMNQCSSSMMQMLKETTDELKKTDKEIHTEIDSLRGGMLSIQSRNFKNDCHKLLKADHVIDLKEYEALLADHIAYNKLGGNHEGDALFAMVEAKYKNTIGTKDHTDGILQ